MTVFSLVLGCEIALAATVIVSGTDLIHKLSQGSDFRVNVTQEASKAFIETSLDMPETVMLTEPMISEITKLAEIKAEDI